MGLGLLFEQKRSHSRLQNVPRKDCGWQCTVAIATILAASTDFDVRVGSHALHESIYGLLRLLLGYMPLLYGRKRLESDWEVTDYDNRKHTDDSIIRDEKTAPQSKFKLL